MKSSKNINPQNSTEITKYDTYLNTYALWLHWLASFRSPVLIMVAYLIRYQATEQKFSLQIN